MVEPQPGAAGLAMSFAFPAQARKDLGRNAFAVVMHREQYLLVLAGQADRDRPFLSRASTPLLIRLDRTRLNSAGWILAKSP